MKPIRTLFAILTMLCLSACLWAAPVTFPGPTILDDAGAKVTPTSISVASVVDLDGNAIASPGAVAHFAASNSSVVYDPATKGEAWVTLTPVLAGHTFVNTPPVIFCSLDPQTLSGTNTKATAVQAQTDKIGTTAADSTNVTGIKAKTDLIATNSGDSPNAVTAQTNAATAATQAAAAATAASGLPSASAIVTALLGATVDSGSGTTLTVKQSLFLSFVSSVGKFGTPVRSTVSPWTITVPYLRLDGTTTGWTYVTTYTDNTFSKATGRNFTPGTLP